MPKLTKRTIDAIKPGASDIVVFDGELPGFGVRIKPSGAKSFFVQFRNVHGRSKRITIGRYGATTPDQARTRAARIRNAVADGADPAADRQALRDAPRMSELLDRYLEEHVERRNRPRTRAEVRRLVDKIIRPKLGGLAVMSVTRADLARLHHDLASTRRQANMVVAVCSKVFGLAETWGLRPEGSNPCRRIERYPEARRERFLSAEELGRLGKALREAETIGLAWRPPAPGKRYGKRTRRPENRRTVLPRQATAAIRLLLYTGARLSDVLTLKWEHVDLAGALVTFPDPKRGGPKRQVLSASAVALIEVLPRVDGSPYVLPMTSDPDRPFSKDTIEGAWQRLRAEAGLEDLRLHDLRHTVGTYAGQAGANAFLVRDLLMHKTVAMTDRYVNRDEDPLRALADSVADRIGQAMDGRQQE